MCVLLTLLVLFRSLGLCKAVSYLPSIASGKISDKAYVAGALRTNLRVSFETPCDLKQPHFAGRGAGAQSTGLAGSASRSAVSQHCQQSVVL